MSGPSLRVEPLTEASWPALEALFREGGDPRWCWCQYWRLRSKDFSAAKVPELRDRLRREAAQPVPVGLVALRGHGPDLRAVGWVSIGPRDDFERIVRSRVIPRIDDRPVWSIVCLAVSATARGRGIARMLLASAVDFARTRGVATLEAYPVVIESGQRGLRPEAAFTGALPMFEHLGFHVVAARASALSASARRVVVRLELQPAHPAAARRVRGQQA